MARTKFELTYFDGSRKQIGCAERTSLLLEKQIRQTGPQSYEYIGQPKTFHTFADYAQWHTTLKINPQLLRHFLERLMVLWKLQSEQELQLEETPEAFAIRLEEMGAVGAADEVSSLR